MKFACCILVICAVVFDHQGNVDFMYSVLFNNVSNGSYANKYIVVSSIFKRSMHIWMMQIQSSLCLRK